MYKVQKQIRVSMWELAHSRLLTNKVRWKRGLALSGDSSRCFDRIESCLHIGGDCEESTGVWMQLLPPSLSEKFFSLSMRKWLEWNLLGQYLKDWNREWPEIMAICCWWQWEWRNESIFNNNTLPLKVMLIECCQSNVALSRAYSFNIISQLSSKETI